MNVTKAFLSGIKVTAMIASLVGNTTHILVGQNKDLMGAAELVFMRPPNPSVRRKNPERPSGSGRSESKETTSAKPSGNSSKSAVDVSDQVEDALALGNAARDQKPPDFSSAERAYRLAWKLNPTDPRPFVGLGNIYLEQERYPEAAKAYKEAIRLGMSKNSTMAELRGGIGITGMRVRRQDLSDWRLLASASLLRHKAYLLAERELTEGILKDTNNARLRALLAYDLFAQERFTEASRYYEEAMQLEPTNPSYRAAVSESSERARALAAGDADLRAKLEGSAWEVRKQENSKAIGAFELRAENTLKCTPSVGDEIPFNESRWNLADGILKIQTYPNGDSFCIGRVGNDSIPFKCLLGDQETTKVWIQKKR
jgi:Flp pilus assembly protein TadD